jgi:hypothetical protein
MKGQSRLALFYASRLNAMNQLMGCVIGMGLLAGRLGSIFQSQLSRKPVSRGKLAIVH